MKRTITILVAVLFTANVFSQTHDWQWAKSAGGNSVGEGQSVATDSNGNVFMTGYFQSSTITFGATILTNTTSTGISDIFIVKYDASGNVLWATSAGGTSSDISYGIAVDGGGNVFVTGFFDSPTITFGTNTLTNANAGSHHMFIVKYDAAGNVIWATCAGGGFSDVGSSTVTDASGNVLVTGFFGSPTITFGTTTLTYTGGYDNMFIVKYDAAGNVLWATSATSAGGVFSDHGNSIATDASGNVLVTGYFNGATITFGANMLTNVGYTDMFIVKYDASGNILWAESAGGNSDDHGNCVNVDPNGNALVTGYFSSPTITFGTTTLTNTSGNSDMFIVKYDGAGNVLWAKSTGNYEIEGLSVATDASGNALVTGYFFSSSITFGTTTFTNTEGYNSFVVKYDTSGNAIWATSIGGTGHASEGLSVSTDANGNVLVTGWFDGSTITFGPITLTNNSPGSSEVFTAKIKVCDLAVPAITASGATTFCQGDSVMFTAPSGYTYLWGNGASTQSITVHTAVTDSVIVTNTNGCSRTSLPISTTSLPTVDTSTSVSSITITANQVGATYQWLNCTTGNSPITGATSQSYTATANGSYAVIVTLNGCSATSHCVTINNMGVDEWADANSVVIYPNPATSELQITSNKYQITNVQIVNVLGEEVIKELIINNGKLTMDVSSLTKGVYFVRIATSAGSGNDTVVNKKIIVQ